MTQLVLTPLLVVGLCLLPAQQSRPKVLYIEGAFLYVFGKYITWPADSIQAKNPQFVIGILGEDPFGPILEKMVAGKKVRGKEVVVTTYTRLADTRNCHILFVGGMPQRQWNRTFAFHRETAVVTVGTVFEQLDAGCMIVFRVEGDKVTFDIDLGLARDNRLDISSNLLKIAATVRK